MSDIDDAHGTNPQSSPAEPGREEQAGPETDALWPYIGDWQALQSGKVYSTLLKKLRERETMLRPCQPLPPEDPLVRYKNIPLHARFLYTSIHPFVEASILKHYTTIDGLSRDRCDIYLSLEQFTNPGETLDYLENSPVLRKAGVQIGYHDLPGIFFWDHQWAGEFIPFGAQASELDIMTILTHVFQEIRGNPTIAAVKQARKILHL